MRATVASHREMILKTRIYKLSGDEQGKMNRRLRLILCPKRVDMMTRRIEVTWGLGKT